METSKAEPADRNQAKAKLDQHDVKVRESEGKSDTVADQDLKIGNRNFGGLNEGMAEKRLRSRAKLCEEKSDLKRDLDSDVKKRRRYQMSIRYEEKMQAEADQRLKNSSDVSRS
ncbi:hypothetical protein F511_33558 [Dorcoceras hygrometricum]|uniref:Uncharacterized protein n=1 Tax=Dorcoceras hygrometricum TaxID=472368 RepID=A0A2Z7ACH4_9LAMI|nr:hypothetical protein F511_33558 [Dorcoceras hygrometricum]